MNIAVKAGPGWQARLDLDYGLRGKKTRLVNKRQLGPLTLQRPFYPEGDTCHSYLLHPPGGVVAGDSLQINVRAGPGAHCLLTTPGATKFYRAAIDKMASQTQHIAVATGAIMEWLPQQNIFFPGARATLSTRIDVESGGKFIGWEIHCLGRPANDEKFSRGTVLSNTHVSISGELRLVESLNIPSEEALIASVGMRGLAMQASFIAGPCTVEHRDTLENILQAIPGGDYPYPIGLTLVDEILVVRALGEQTEPLMRIFTLLWSALRQQWLARSPCVPRIWAT